MEILERLSGALHLVEGHPVGSDERLARYAKHVEASARTVQREAGQGRPDLAQYFSRGMGRRLAEYFGEPGFRSLTDARAREALGGVILDSGGGRGKTGPVQVAAELAVEVEAFGFGQREGEMYEDAVRRASKRIGEAKSKTRSI